MRNFNRCLLIGTVALSGFVTPPKTAEGFVGYAIASVTENSIKAKGIGLADKKSVTQYDTLTTQPVGSISKTLIGLSLMIARDQGLIDLDEDINTYLDFQVENPRVSEDNIITLRHLATHTSGIVDNGKFYYKEAYVSGTKSNLPLGTYLRQYLANGGEMYSKKNFSKHEAGTYYEYSNVAAALAAYVLERASSVPFNEFTQQNILKPLKMNQSGWFYDEIDTTTLATLYDEEGNTLEPYTLVTYPDGGFKTSIQDLSIYLQELMKGYHHRSSLLADASWDELFRKNFTDKNPVENIDLKEPNSGIFIVYSKSGKIGHTGSDPGVSAMMWFDPATSEGNIFMANQDITEDNVGKFKSIWASLK